jgi:hypothetical protein
MCGYFCCPEKGCLNKAENIVYKTMKPDGTTTEANSRFKAPE